MVGEGSFFRRKVAADLSADTLKNNGWTSNGDSLDNSAIKMFGRGGSGIRREKLIMNDAETSRVSRLTGLNISRFPLCHAMRSNEFTFGYREVRREILNFRFRFGVRSVSDRCKLGSFRGYRKYVSMFKHRLGCCSSKLSSCRNDTLKFLFTIFPSIPTEILTGRRNEEFEKRYI